MNMGGIGSSSPYWRVTIPVSTTSWVAHFPLPGGRLFAAVRCCSLLDHISPPPFRRRELTCTSRLVKLLSLHKSSGGSSGMIGFSILGRQLVRLLSVPWASAASRRRSPSLPTNHHPLFWMPGGAGLAGTSLIMHPVGLLIFPFFLPLYFPSLPRNKQPSFQATLRI